MTGILTHRAALFPALLLLALIVADEIETARVHAAWRAEAVAPEAVRIAREMAVQA